MSSKRFLFAAALAAVCATSVSAPAMAGELSTQANPYRVGDANCGAKNVTLNVTYFNQWDLRVVIHRASDDSYWEKTIPGLHVPGSAFVTQTVVTPLTDGSWQATVLTDFDDALENVTVSCT